MASTAEVTGAVVVNDGTRDVTTFVQSSSVAIAAGVGDGTMQTVAIANGFNALTVPTGAKGVLIKLVSGALTLTLKGVTGDTGIKMQSGTLSTVPIMLPLGTTPSIGIAADGAGTIEILWY